MRISDWSSDVCSSDLTGRGACEPPGQAGRPDPQGTRYRAAGAGARRALSPGRSSHTERHEHGRLPGVTAGPIVRHRSVLLASDHPCGLTMRERVDRLVGEPNTWEIGRDHV